MPEEKNLPDPAEVDLSDIDVDPDDSDIESVTLSEQVDSDEEDNDSDEEDNDSDEEDDNSDEEDNDSDEEDDDSDEEDADSGEEDADSGEDILGGAIDSDDDSDEEDNMQKIDRSNMQNYINENHPEKNMHNQEEIEALSKVFRNKYGDIEDEFHKTVPFITRFEKTKILGLRARQLNKSPEQALVKVDMGIIDGYKIAEEEYKQKLIPFIIKRTLPNGSCEYWKFEDLIQLD